jgi:hypothetical protein
MTSEIPQLDNSILIIKHGRKQHQQKKERNTGEGGKKEGRREIKEEVKERNEEKT